MSGAIRIPCDPGGQAASSVRGRPTAGAAGLSKDAGHLTRLDFARLSTQLRGFCAERVPDCAEVEFRRNYALAHRPAAAYVIDDGGGGGLVSEDVPFPLPVFVAGQPRAVAVIRLELGEVLMCGTDQHVELSEFLSVGTAAGEAAYRRWRLRLTI